MYKSFTTALLAATVFADTSADLSLASKTRGKGDGTDNDNAVYCDLGSSSGGDIRMDLFTYMTNSNDVLDLHGETKVYLNGASLFNGAVQEFGFCMEMTAEVAATTTDSAVPATWDCQSVQIAWTTENFGSQQTQAAAQHFKGWADWKYTGSAADFSFDSARKEGNPKMTLDQAKNDAGEIVDSVSDKATNNWQISEGKTFTNCTSAAGKGTCARPLIDAEDADWMSSGITYHWFRNFKTQDEAGYDLEVKGTDTMSANTFGFYWAYGQSGNIAKAITGTEFKSAAPVSCTVITAAAYKELKTDPDAKKAAEEENKNNEDGNTEDWAAQTTAQATALLAAVYALVF